MVDRGIPVSNALIAMAAAARGMHVGGVATIMSTVDGIHFEMRALVVDRIERLPDPATRGESDTGTNYLAVALSKGAQMALTGVDSGMQERAPCTGELNYRGGVVGQSNGTTYYFSFSGGTQDEDVLIAQAGRTSLIP